MKKSLRLPGRAAAVCALVTVMVLAQRVSIADVAVTVTVPSTEHPGHPSATPPTDSRLPRTGVDVQRIVLAALAALAGGVALIVAGRKAERRLRR